MLRAHPETVRRYDAGESTLVRLREGGVEGSPFVGFDCNFGRGYVCGCMPAGEVMVNIKSNSARQRRGRRMVCYRHPRCMGEGADERGESGACLLSICFIHVPV